MPSEPYSFSRQAAVGKVGEAAVIEWLGGQGYQVEDVSGDKVWRDRDVDVILDGSLYAEIKTDTHPAGNIFVELTVDGKPGYLYKSRADVLLYYFPGAGKLLWLSVAALAWWVHEHASALHRIQVRSRRRYGQEWVAEGIVVPVADLAAAGLVKEYEL